MTRSPSLGTGMAAGGISSTAQSNTSPWRYCRVIGSLLSAGGRDIAADCGGWDELQGSAHFPIVGAPGELGRQGPQVDAVFPAKGSHANPVLLVVMGTTEADAKDVVRHLPDTGIGGRAHMGKVDPRRRAT